MATAGNEAELQALQLYQQHNPDGALAIVNAAIDKDQEHAGLWLLKAALHHSQAEWREALVAAETAMTLTPLPLGVQLVLADSYVHTGQVDLAMVGYQHLLSLRPLPAKLYAGLYAGLRRCGRNDLALAACRGAVEVDPENDAAYFGMAHCMVLLGYSAAYIASVLRVAVRLAPENAVYRTSLAIQLLRDGDPTEAHRQLSRVEAKHLNTIECACSARKLLGLCVWAKDGPRARVLGRLAARLPGGSAPPQARDK